MTDELTRKAPEQAMLRIRAFDLILNILCILFAFDLKSPLQSFDTQSFDTIDNFINKNYTLCMKTVIGLIFFKAQLTPIFVLHRRVSALLQFLRACYRPTFWPKTVTNCY